MKLAFTETLITLQKLQTFLPQMVYIHNTIVQQLLNAGITKLLEV